MSPRGDAVISFECLIEIAAVAVSQHGGNFLYGQICAIQQQPRPLHSGGKQQLGKGFSCFLRKQP